MRFVLILAIALLGLSAQGLGADAREKWAIPHVSLIAEYEDKKRTLFIIAKTELTPSNNEIYLSKEAQIKINDLSSDIIISEDRGFFSIKSTKPQSHVLFEIQYTLTLPEFRNSPRNRDSANADWSGNSNGAFLPSSRIWYPLLNGPSTVDIQISTPKHLTAVAPGKKIRTYDNGQLNTSVFSMNQPIQGIDLIIGNWSIEERVFQGKTKDINLYTYLDKGNKNLANEYLALTEEYIIFYEDLIGPYPYDSFSIVSSPRPTGLGMPSLTYLSEKILKYPFIKKRSLPHEILHNWLGNGVMVDSTSGNWAEGLTTYLADYLITELENKNNARSMRYSWLRDYAAIQEEDERPLDQFTSRYHSASKSIGYGKGAMFFHMLKNLIGEPSFKACLKNFWIKYKFKVASFTDIQKTCQKATEIDLNNFFHYWLTTTGAPSLEIKHNEIHQNGQWVIPLDVLYIGANGSTSIRTDIEKNSQELKIPKNSRMAMIDPDFNVWRALATGESPTVIRDFIASRVNTYENRISRLANTGNIINQHFLENPIFEDTNLLDASDKQWKSIILTDIKNVNHYMTKNKMQTKDMANDFKFLIITTNIKERPTMIIGIAESITNNEFTNLISRARHYGKYSWLGVKTDQTTGKGIWEISSPSFSVKP